MGENSDNIKKIIEQFATQQETIVKAFASVQLVSPQFIQQISAIRNEIQQFSKHYESSISKIVDVIKSIDWKGLEELDKEFGWLETISMSYMVQLKDILKKHGKEAVWEKLVIDLNDDDFLNSLKLDVESIPLIENRSRIIVKSLDHHKNKDFISSVPLLLSQIEGIVWDLGVYKKLVEDRPNSKYKVRDGGYVIDSKGKKIEWKLGDLLQHMFGTSSRLANYTEESVYSKELRHPILHGRQKNYDNAQNSTMLVLLLHVLLEKIKDEDTLNSNHLPD